MFCNLTKEDCAAIYHALGCIHAANLQARIGLDGELLEKGDGHLFRGDARTIYDALGEERERVLQGAYDAYPGEVKQAGSITFKLAEHLKETIAKIGVRGEELNVALHPSRI